MNILHPKSSKRKVNANSEYPETSDVIIKKIKQEPQECFALESESEGAVKVDDELTVWFEEGIKEEEEIIVKIEPSEEECNATIQSKERNHSNRGGQGGQVFSKSPSGLIKKSVGSCNCTCNLTEKLLEFMPPDLKKLLKECFSDGEYHPTYF